MLELKYIKWIMPLVPIFKSISTKIFLGRCDSSTLMWSRIFKIDQQQSSGKGTCDLKLTTREWKFLITNEVKQREYESCWPWTRTIIIIFFSSNIISRLFNHKRYEKQCFEEEDYLWKGHLTLKENRPPAEFRVMLRPAAVTMYNVNKTNSNLHIS